MSSLRVFLITALLATIILINFLAAYQGYRNAMQQTQDLLDSHLEQYLQILSVHANNAVPMTPATNLSPVNNRAEIIYQVINNDGQIISRSDNAPHLTLQITQEGYKDINHAGYRWRAITRQFPTSGVKIIVAERADLRYQIAESIVLQSVFPILLGLPFLGVIIFIIINTGLKPIKQLAHQLHQRKASNLTPISLDNIPRELHLLVESTNGLLSRLEASFEREKRFASDAAHELRTPIAALSLHLQNTLKALAQPCESLQKAQQSAQRLGQIVEQILTLNRTAAEQYMGNFTTINFFDVIKRTIENHIELLNNKHQKIEFDGSQIELYADQFALEILVNNLLSNAIKYTPENGSIKINLKETEQKVLFSIMDSGPGIPKDKYEQVFERFYRLGGDRHNSNTLGCGLGLPIVRQIVDLHQASISLDKSTLSDSGLCVNITFAKKEK